jgi:hypothetical protein
VIHFSNTRTFIAVNIPERDCLAMLPIGNITGPLPTAPLAALAT